MLLAKVICLIACHGGPAEHFSTFAEELLKEGYRVEIYACGDALKKFLDCQLDVKMSFAVEDLSKETEEELATQIAKRCSQADVVMTDVGHIFDVTLQKALAKEASQALRLAYYDNPEPYVPGGYSSTAAKVMLCADRVLFANSNLVKNRLYESPGREVSLPIQDRVGIGYYPTMGVKTMIERRIKEKVSMRAQFFKDHDLEDTYQEVMVYFGGNNEEYFMKALPAFLEFLQEGMKQIDLSNKVLVMQQHPGAKRKNRDRQEVEKWLMKYAHNTRAPKIIISDFSSEDVQVIADRALYYQTSRGPLLALIGIPLIQVGHHTYEDVLIRGNVCCSVTNAPAFVKAISELKYTNLSEEKKKALFESLGIKEKWFKSLQDSARLVDHMLPE